MKSAILAIRIIGDATSAVAAMDKAQRASMTFQEKISKAASVAKVSLAAIAGGAAVCAKSAADLQQSVGGVETVFGGASTRMLQWSRDAAQSAGLSQNAYNEMATVIGSQLQNMGMAQDMAAGKTNDLIGLGADLSSMFGDTTADAVDALSSALKGEMDPIEKYGISLNDATLKAQATSMGLGDLYKAGDRNAKMQATLATITAQSGKAVGNFAREADTAQGQQARMTAEFQNATAALGQALLPALTQGATLLAQFAGWVQQNSTWLVPFIGIIAAVAAVIVVMNATMSAYTTVTTLAAIANGALNLSLLPIVIGIGAIIAAIILCIKYWDGIKQAGAAAAQWIADRWNQFWQWITGVFTAIGATGQRIFNGMPASAQAVIGIIQGAFQMFTGVLTGNFDMIGRGAQKIFDSLPGWAQAAIQGVIGFFTGLKNTVLAIFDAITGAIKGAFDWASNLWGQITGAKSAAAGIPQTQSQAMSYSLQNEAILPRAYQFARTVRDVGAVAATPLASSPISATTISTRPVIRQTRNYKTYSIKVEAGIGDKYEIGKQVRKVLDEYEDTKR